MKTPQMWPEHRRAIFGSGYEIRFRSVNILDRLSPIMRKFTLYFLSFSIGLLLAGQCTAGSSEIQIMAPLRPKYVAKGYTRIYLADFSVSGEHNLDRQVNININKEIKETLKSEFIDRSAYAIEDLKIEIPPDRKPEEVLKDASFWMAMEIQDRGNSLILAGAVEFSNHEKGGLVTERVTNPRTGTQRVVTSSQERLQLILGINLLLIEAKNGEKLFEETFKEEEVYDDITNVSLPLFYDLFERIAPKIVGVLVPYRVAGSRTLLQP